jgi:hypothetical protein
MEICGFIAEVGMQCGSVSRFRDRAGGRASARVCRRWVQANIKPHG